MYTKITACLSIGLLTLLSSCDQFQPDVTPDNAAVPQAVVSGLRQAFPSAQNVRFSVLEKNTVWNADFKVNQREYDAKLSRSGAVLEVFKAPQAGETLPVPVQNYLRIYEGFTIKSWSVSTDNPPIYRVVLNRDNVTMAVDVDANGRFYNRFSLSENQTATQSYAQQLTDLPAPIQAYLQGYEFKRAAVILSNNQKTYAVSAAKDDKIYLLQFNEVGTLLSSAVVSGAPQPNPTPQPNSQELRREALPASVTGYLDQNYPGWTLRRATAEATNGQISGYTVIFVFNNRSYTATFDGAGKFLRVAN